MLRHKMRTWRKPRLLGYWVLSALCALPLAALGLQFWIAPPVPQVSVGTFLVPLGLSVLSGVAIGWLVLLLRASRRQAAALTARQATLRVELEKQLRRTEKMETLEELTRRASHDLNDLVTVISGHAETLARRPAYSLDAVLRDAVTAIRGSAEDATRLAGELLNPSGFPAARQMQEPPRFPVGPKARAGTILVAEDHDSLRRLIRTILEAGGHTVLAARDGAEALQVAAAELNRLDLVVTDLNMPRIGGRELVEGLRILRPDLKVLYISGYSQPPDGAATLEPNASFLAKPFTTTLLLSAVAKLLAGSASETAPVSR